MKNLVLRCITGIVYIALIVVALFTNLPLFFIVFGVIMLFALNEFYKNLKYKDITIDYILANALALSIFTLPFQNHLKDEHIIETLQSILFFLLIRHTFYLFHAITHLAEPFLQVQHLPE